MPRSTHESSILNRFGIKQAAVDISALLPALALPAVGVFAGRRLGGRLGGELGRDVGQLIGGIGGGVSGQVISHAINSSSTPPSQQIQQAQQDQQTQQAPPDAPFAIDPTSDDIPDWALLGTKILRPLIEQGKTAGIKPIQGLRDIVLGDVLGNPFYATMEGLRGNGGALNVLKHLGYSTAGIAGGGLLGHLVGQALPRANIWGVPISSILSGLGATLGGAKGFQVAREGPRALRNPAWSSSG